MIIPVTRDFLLNRERYHAARRDQIRHAEKVARARVQPEVQAPVKRGRGRPRKDLRVDEQQTES